MNLIIALRCGGVKGDGKFRRVGPWGPEIRHIVAVPAYRALWQRGSDRLGGGAVCPAFGLDGGWLDDRMTAGSNKLRAEMGPEGSYEF